MSTLETRKVEPLSGTTVTLGASGDVVTMPAGVTVKTNTVKDAGGNTLWTSDGSGTLSSVNSALKPGMVFISSQTASSSTSISFTTGLDSTYNEYVFYFTNINPATDAAHFQFNGSGSGRSYTARKTTAVFQSWHAEANNTDGASLQAGHDIAQDTGYQRIMSNMSNDADEGGAGELHIFTPTNSTYVKNFYIRTAFNHEGGRANDYFIAGYFNTPAGVTAIDFQMSSGAFDGTIALYGIR